MVNKSFTVSEKLYEDFKTIVTSEHLGISEVMNELLSEWMYKYKDTYPNLMPPIVPPQKPQSSTLISKPALQNLKVEITSKMNEIEYTLKPEVDALRSNIYKDSKSENNLKFELSLIELEIKKRELRKILKEEPLVQPGILNDKELEKLIGYAKKCSDYT